MDDAERVDEVVRLIVESGRQLLRVRLDEADAVRNAHHFRALGGDGQRLAGELDGSELGARPGEVDRVGPDAATHLENALVLPAIELGERRNVWLDEVLPRLDLVEVLLRADRLRRVADVAGTGVPVSLDVRDRFVDGATSHLWSRAVVTRMSSRRYGP